jgi:hypothetical protein
MTALSASTAASAAGTALARDRQRRRGLRSRWLLAAANGTGGRSQLRMRVHATDGNAQIPPSAAWHRCLTVQLRA